MTEAQMDFIITYGIISILSGFSILIITIACTLHYFMYKKAKRTTGTLKCFRYYVERHGYKYCDYNAYGHEAVFEFEVDGKKVEGHTGEHVPKKKLTKEDIGKQFEIKYLKEWGYLVYLYDENIEKTCLKNFILNIIAVFIILVLPVYLVIRFYS